LRQETQSTVETLRKEFADLVEELVQYKKDADKPSKSTLANEVTQPAEMAVEQPKQSKPFAVPKLNLNKK
jgi:TPP-dependent pyruvate/acetoin dehydrogenase alpha subunit